MLLILFLVLLQLLLSPAIIAIVLLRRRHTVTGVTILSIYIALMGFTLVYAELRPRSTSGHILRCLKGEYGLKQHANDLAEDTEKVINPSEIQQWAVVVLRETQNTNDDFELPIEKVLPSIRNLRSSGLPFEFVSYDHIEPTSPQERSVWIVWGGGFGHWGIRVGSPAFKIKPVENDNYYREWKPGIYFWCETH